MYREEYEDKNCKLEFTGEESSLNYLKVKILEMIKNKQKNCIQFLLEKEFKDIEVEDYYDDSIFCGNALDHDFNQIGFLFNSNSIILKIDSCCFYETVPYYSEICVKYNLNCKLVCRFMDYGWYEFYILYKTGKCKYRSYTYSEIQSILNHEIRNNQKNINIDIRDIYLKKYDYLCHSEKEWMLKLIDEVVSLHSTEVLFN